MTTKREPIPAGSAFFIFSSTNRYRSFLKNFISAVKTKIKANSIELPRSLHFSLREAALNRIPFRSRFAGFACSAIGSAITVTSATWYWSALWFPPPCWPPRTRWEPTRTEIWYLIASKDANRFPSHIVKYLKKQLVCAFCYRCWATLTTSSLLFSRSKSASKWSRMASSSTRARFAGRLLICSIFSLFALLSFPWQPGIILFYVYINILTQSCMKREKNPFFYNLLINYNYVIVLSLHKKNANSVIKLRGRVSLEKKRLPWKIALRYFFVTESYPNCFVLVPLFIVCLQLWRILLYQSAPGAPCTEAAACHQSR